jgi:hypothetical protein
VAGTFTSPTAANGTFNMSILNPGWPYNLCIQTGTWNATWQQEP